MIAEVEARREEIEELCRRYGVRRLYIFGSAVDGESFRSDTSDIDFLVEFESPGAQDDAERYSGMMHALEDLFGRSVDLVVDSAITNPYFRSAVDETRVPLDAA